MKLNTLVTAVFLLLISSLYGQYQLSGLVNDENNQGLEFANVLLLVQQDSSLLKGTITDKDGQYVIENIPAGSYLLSIAFVGYVETSQILEVKADTNIELITLMPMAEAMDEVVVVAKKPLYEQKIDRMVINVQNQVVSAGGTALEVLERSPGVVVDRSRNLLSLAGKEGVLIMVNGKVSRQPIDAIMQMLDGMNADNVEKIELITNPPAKYEAGSNGGIINIQILKREDLGTNGAYSISAGYGQEDKEGATLNINHRKKKINVFGDFSFNRNRSPEIYTNDRTVTETGNTFISQTITDRDPIATNFNGRLGIDVDVNSTTTIGAFVSGFSNKWDMDAFNTGFEDLNASKTLFEVKSKEKNQWQHLMSNFNVSQKMKKGNLNFDIDYLFYEQDNPTSYQNTFSAESGQVIGGEAIRASKKTPINIWVSRLDYSMPITEKINFDFGVKGTLSDLENEVIVENEENGAFILNGELSETSFLNERIGAVYSSVNFPLSDKTQMNVGLRYEYTETNLDTREEEDVVDLKYGELFPTVFLSHQLNTDWTIQSSYGRRIARPAYNDLAPFVIFIDPNTYFFGNVALQPSISNNFKVDVKYKSYLFSLQYYREQDAIAQYQPTLLEGTNQQVFTSVNLDYRNSLVAVLSVPVQLTKWWHIRMNAMGITRQILTMDNEKLSADNVRFNADNSFTLPKDFSVEVSGFYQSESIWGISNLSPFGNITIGIQKKLSPTSKLRLTVNNLFGFDYDVYTADGLLQNYEANTNYSYEPRIFRLTYSNSFGNNKLKSSRRRSTGSEDIKGRVN